MQAEEREVDGKNNAGPAGWSASCNLVIPISFPFGCMVCLSVVGGDNKPIWMQAEEREEDGKNNAGPAGWLECWFGNN